MLDHLGLRTAAPPRLIAFYAAALAPLGYAKIVEWEDGAGFGEGTEVDLWIQTSDQPTSSVHLAFRAKDQAAVEAFHAAALTAGGVDNGAPGRRGDGEHASYAAFVIDPDGNNLEATLRLS